MANSSKPPKRLSASDITQQYLKERLHYDPETGVFTWRSLPYKNQRKPGDVAGSYNSDGYRVIVLGNRIFGAHRLAWLYMTGKWPPSEMDHINRIRDDNRWCNLRLAERWQNTSNTGVPSNNRAGIKGVRKMNDRWQARIRHKHVTVHLGTFDTPELARAAYEAAAIELKGDFAGVQPR